MGKSQNKTFAFVSGILAVFIWGIGPVFVRTLSESMGIMTSGAISCIGGGILAVIYKYCTVSREERKASGRVPYQYWLICGVCSVLFTICSALSVGLSETREQVVSTGVIRLMWPPLALLLTIPINHAKVSKWFYLCFAGSVVGMVIANLDPDCHSAADFFLPFIENWAVCLLALISSVAWGIYSNFLGKYVKNRSQDHVWVLMMASGVIELILAIVWKETFVFQMRQVGELLFMIVASSFLASILWNAAMAGPKKITVIVISNFLPVISTLLVSVMLGVQLTWLVVIGSLLVVAGTLGCKACFKEQQNEA